jgi:histidinol-phosphate aminotransferase
VLSTLLRPELAVIPRPEAAPIGYVAKLDANEIPLSLPPSAAAELGETLAAVALHRYGDDSASALRTLICTRLGVHAEQICFGNGSNELIRLLATVFARPRSGECRAKVLYPSPTFFGYRAAALLAGADAVEVPLRSDMELDPQAIDRALEESRPNLAFFCRPNNPTGTLWSRPDLIALVHSHPDVLFVIDEVYQAYAGTTLVDVAGERENVVVLRSLSKIGGAGLRVGYGVGHPAVIAAIDRVRPPFTVSALNNAAALWLLSRGAVYSTAAIAGVIEERKRITGALGKIEGLAVFPSSANYLLIRCGVPGDQRATDLWRRLRERGVMVSNFDSPGPLAGCLRVTVGARVENDLFLEALRAEW